MDVTLAGATLVCLSPLMAGIALAVWATMGRPVLFLQQRPGLHGQPFKLPKFRSMREAAGPDGRPLPDSERLAHVGSLLRRTSLDELPQLWNVFLGEMSLVGPRPLLMEYLDRYSPQQARRHEVRPGVTGWAQVNGRNALTWEEKFRLDVWYVDHACFWLDLKILALTAWRVLTGSGVSARGDATMPEFLGSRSRKDRGI